MLQSRMERHPRTTKPSQRKMKIKAAFVLLALVAFVGLLQSAAACSRLTDPAGCVLHGNGRYSFHRLLDELLLRRMEELEETEDEQGSFDVYDEDSFFERQLRFGSGSSVNNFLWNTPSSGYAKCGNGRSYVDSRQMPERIDTKSAISDACRKNGCTAQERALLVALVFQETTKLCGSDTSKGTSSSSSNWSPYNMNKDFLGRVGCNSDCARSLGQHCGRQNVNKATYYMLKALRGNKFEGACGVINFHRGGSTTFKECRGKQCTCSGGAAKANLFRAAIAKMTRDVLRTPRYLTDSTRLCMKTPHWRI